jgi:hypothetical protein
MQNALFIIALIIFICAMIIPIRIRLHYFRESSVKKTEFQVKIWFIPVYFQKNDQTTIPISPGNILKRPPFSAFFPSRRKANAILRIMNRPIKIKKLYLYTELSMADAAQTAIAVGFAWWIVGIFHSWLHCFFNLLGTEKEVKVIPNYQQLNYFLLDFSCILEFPLGHIMIILFYNLLHSRTIKKYAKEVCL